MSKYYSNTIRIISIITLIAFISTQTAAGYEGRPASTQVQKSHLRLQQPDKSEEGSGLANALGGQLKKSFDNTNNNANSIGGNKVLKFIHYLFSTTFAVSLIKLAVFRAHSGYIFDATSLLGVMDRYWFNDLIAIPAVAAGVYIIYSVVLPLICFLQSFIDKNYNISVDDSEEYKVFSKLFVRWAAVLDLVVCVLAELGSLFPHISDPVTSKLIQKLVPNFNPIQRGLVFDPIDLVFYVLSFIISWGISNLLYYPGLSVQKKIGGDSPGAGAEMAPPASVGMSVADIDGPPSAGAAAGEAAPAGGAEAPRAHAAGGTSANMAENSVVSGGLGRDISGYDVDVLFWTRPTRVCLQLGVRGRRISQLAFYSSMLSLFLGGYTKKPIAPKAAAKKYDNAFSEEANLTKTSEPKAAAMTIKEAFIRVLPKILRLADVYIAIVKKDNTPVVLCQVELMPLSEEKGGAAGEAAAGPAEAPRADAAGGADANMAGAAKTALPQTAAAKGFEESQSVPGVDTLADSAQEGKIDINTSTAEELVKNIPGLSKGAAKSIIEERDRMPGGVFRSYRQLQASLLSNRVRGVGRGMLNFVMSKVHIENAISISPPKIIYTREEEAKSEINTTGEVSINPNDVISAFETFFTVEEFVDAALYGELGFYSTGRMRFGIDYTTCPRGLSPFFGIMAAEHIFKMWLSIRDSLGDDEKFYIIELAAGEGYLTHDILAYAREKSDEGDAVWKEFYSNTRYVSCDLSKRSCLVSELKSRRFVNEGVLEIQHKDAFVLLDEYKTAPKRGVILSNEFFDNIPPHQVRIGKDGSKKAALLLPYVIKDALDYMVRKDFVKRDDLMLVPSENDSNISFISKQGYIDILKKLRRNEWNGLHEDLRGAFGLYTAYVDVSYVPEVKEYLDFYRDEIREAVDKANSDITVFISPRHKKLIKVMAGALKAGYIFSIDYFRKADDILNQNNTQYAFFHESDKKLDHMTDLGKYDITFNFDATYIAKIAELFEIEFVFFGNQSNLEKGTSTDVSHNSLKPYIVSNLLRVTLDITKDENEAKIRSLLRSDSSKEEIAVVEAIVDFCNRLPQMVLDRTRTLEDYFRDLVGPDEEAVAACSPMLKVFKEFVKKAEEKADKEVKNFYDPYFKMLILSKNISGSGYEFPADSEDIYDSMSVSVVGAATGGMNGIDTGKAAEELLGQGYCVIAYPANEELIITLRRPYYGDSTRLRFDVFKAGKIAGYLDLCVKDEDKTVFYEGTFVNSRFNAEEEGFSRQALEFLNSSPAALEEKSSAIQELRKNTFFHSGEEDFDVLLWDIAFTVIGLIGGETIKIKIPQSSESSFRRYGFEGLGYDMFGMYLMKRNIKAAAGGADAKGTGLSLPAVTAAKLKSQTVQEPQEPTGEASTGGRDGTAAVVNIKFIEGESEEDVDTLEKCSSHIRKIVPDFADLLEENRNYWNVSYERAIANIRRAASEVKFKDTVFVFGPAFELADIPLDVLQQFKTIYIADVSLDVLHSAKETLEKNVAFVGKEIFLLHKDVTGILAEWVRTRDSIKYPGEEITYDDRIRYIVTDEMALFDELAGKDMDFNDYPKADFIISPNTAVSLRESFSLYRSLTDMPGSGIELFTDDRLRSQFRRCFQEFQMQLIRNHIALLEYMLRDKNARIYLSLDVESSDFEPSQDNIASYFKDGKLKDVKMTKATALALNNGLPAFIKDNFFGQLEIEEEYNAWHWVDCIRHGHAFTIQAMSLRNPFRIAASAGEAAAGGARANSDGEAMRTTKGTIRDMQKIMSMSEEEQIQAFKEGSVAEVRFLDPMVHIRFLRLLAAQVFDDPLDVARLRCNHFKIPVKALNNRRLNNLYMYYNKMCKNAESTLSVIDFMLDRLNLSSRGSWSTDDWLAYLSNQDKVQDWDLVPVDAQRELLQLLAKQHKIPVRLLWNPDFNAPLEALKDNDGRARSLLPFYVHYQILKRRMEKISPELKDISTIEFMQLRLGLPTLRSATVSEQIEAFKMQRMEGWGAMKGDTKLRLIEYLRLQLRQGDPPKYTIANEDFRIHIASLNNMSLAGLYKYYRRMKLAEGISGPLIKFMLSRIDWERLEEEDFEQRIKKLVAGERGEKGEVPGFKEFAYTTKQKKRFWKYKYGLSRGVRSEELAMELIQPKLGIINLVMSPYEAQLQPIEREEFRGICRGLLAKGLNDWEPNMSVLDHYLYIALLEGLYKYAPQIELKRHPFVIGNFKWSKANLKLFYQVRYEAILDRENVFCNELLQGIRNENAALINKVIRKRSHEYSSDELLYFESYIMEAIWKAIINYEPEAGAFSTLLTWNLRGAFSHASYGYAKERGMLNYDRRTAVSKVVEAQLRLHGEFGREPSYDEIAAELGMNADSVKEAIGLASLDAVASLSVEGHDGEEEIYNISDPAGSDDYDPNNILGEIITKYTKELGLDFLRLRVVEDLYLDEIGRRMGISHTTVSNQVANEILVLLRDSDFVEEVSDYIREDEIVERLKALVGDSEKSWRWQSKPKKPEAESAGGLVDIADNPFSGAAAAGGVKAPRADGAGGMKGSANTAGDTANLANLTRLESGGLDVSGSEAAAGGVKALRAHAAGGADAKGPGASSGSQTVKEDSSDVDVKNRVVRKSSHHLIISTMAEKKETGQWPIPEDGAYIFNFDAHPDTSGFSPPAVWANLIRHTKLCKEIITPIHPPFRLSLDQITDVTANVMMKVLINKAKEYGHPIILSFCGDFFSFHEEGWHAEEPEAAKWIDYIFGRFEENGIEVCGVFFADSVDYLNLEKIINKTIDDPFSYESNGSEKAEINVYLDKIERLLKQRMKRHLNWLQKRPSAGAAAAGGMKGKANSSGTVARAEGAVTRPAQVNWTNNNAAAYSTVSIVNQTASPIIEEMVKSHKITQSQIERLNVSLTGDIVEYVSSTFKPTLIDGNIIWLKDDSGVDWALELRKEFVEWLNADKIDRSVPKNFPALSPFLELYNQAGIQLEDPAEFATAVHNILYRIHQFDKGKGNHRTGWVLMNIIRIRAGLRPLIYHKKWEKYYASVTHYSAIDPLRFRYFVSMIALVEGVTYSRYNPINGTDSVQNISRNNFKAEAKIVSEPNGTVGEASAGGMNGTPKASEVSGVPSSQETRAAERGAECKYYETPEGIAQLSRKLDILRRYDFKKKARIKHFLKKLFNICLWCDSKEMTPGYISQALKNILNRRKSGMIKGIISCDAMFIWEITDYFMPWYKFKLNSYSDLENILQVFENPFRIVKNDAYKVFDMGSGDGRNLFWLDEQLRGMMPELKEEGKLALFGMEFENKGQSYDAYRSFGEQAKIAFGDARNTKIEKESLDLVTASNPDADNVFVFAWVARQLLVPGGPFWVIIHPENAEYYSSKLGDDYLPAIKTFLAVAGFNNVTCFKLGNADVIAGYKYNEVTQGLNASGAAIGGSAKTSDAALEPAGEAAAGGKGAATASAEGLAAEPYSQQIDEERLKKIVEAIEAMGGRATLTDIGRYLGYKKEKVNAETIFGKGVDYRKLLEEINIKQMSGGRLFLEIIDATTKKRQDMIITELEVMRGRASSTELAILEGRLKIRKDARRYPRSSIENRAIGINSIANSINFEALNYNRQSQGKPPLMPLIHPRTKFVQDLVLVSLEELGGWATVGQLEAYSGSGDLDPVVDNMNWDAINQWRKKEGLFPLEVLRPTGGLSWGNLDLRKPLKKIYASAEIKKEMAGWRAVFRDVCGAKKAKSLAYNNVFRGVALPFLHSCLYDNGEYKAIQRVVFERIKWEHVFQAAIETIISFAADKGLSSRGLSGYFRYVVPRAINVSRNILNPAGIESSMEDHVEFMGEINHAQRFFRENLENAYVQLFNNKKNSILVNTIYKADPEENVAQAVERLKASGANKILRESILPSPTSAVSATGIEAASATDAAAAGPAEAPRANAAGGADAKRTGLSSESQMAQEEQIATAQGAGDSWSAPILPEDMPDDFDSWYFPDGTTFKSTRDWATGEAISLRHAHSGLDFAFYLTKQQEGIPIVPKSIPPLTNVRAFKDGTVVKVERRGGYSTGYGSGYRYVILEHPGGEYTIYAHLAREITVEEGDHVEKGQIIGKLFEYKVLDGIPAHLHFQYSKNDPTHFMGIAEDQEDPLSVLKGLRSYVEEQKQPGLFPKPAKTSSGESSCLNLTYEVVGEGVSNVEGPSDEADAAGPAEAPRAPAAGEMKDAADRIAVVRALELAKEQNREKLVIVIGDEALVADLNSHGIKAVGANDEAHAQSIKNEEEYKAHFVIILNMSIAAKTIQLDLKRLPVKIEGEVKESLQKLLGYDV